MKEHTFAARVLHSPKMALSLSFSSTYCTSNVIRIVKFLSSTIKCSPQKYMPEANTSKKPEWRQDNLHEFNNKNEVQERLENKTFI